MVGVKLFFVVNVDSFFLSHRLPLGLEALKRGYQVTVVAIDTGKKEEIEKHGMRFVSLPISRSGTDIWTELGALWFLYRLYRKEKPQIVHHIAIKAVTYGSIAARMAGVPKVVNAISGLGFVFINAADNKILYQLLLSLFKIGLSSKRVTVIFQNLDDLDFFKNLKVLKPAQMVYIKGSGVDLCEFFYTENETPSPIRVVLPARMLRDKGVEEFVAAAQMLKPKYGEQVQFILAGGVDIENKAGIPEHQLLQWAAEGSVDWIGFQQNMAAVFRASHIVVLPSYREGLPKALIEACATGRAIVTTDVPGCREVVTTGVNGILVNPKDVQGLSMALDQLITNPDLCKKMGKMARQKAEHEFSIHSVVEKTFNIYKSD